MRLNSKNKIGVGVLILFFSFGYSQQNSLFNTYSYDLMQLNIAAAGRTCFESNLNYRTQWLGVKETPKLYQLNVGISLQKNNGLGLKVAQQTMGLLKNTNATLGYTYRVKLNETSKLHFGVGLAWQQNNFVANKAIVLDNNDVSLVTDLSTQRINNFDSEAGLLFLGDKLTASISAFHLYNSNRKFDASLYKTVQQFNMALAYKFNKGKIVEIEPWLVNRYALGGINQPEGMINVKFKQVFTVGAGYRLNYGFLSLIGFDLNKFKMAYSFDYGSSKLLRNLGSTHQINIGFDLCKSRNQKKKIEVITETPTPPAKTEPVVINEEPKQEEPKVVIAEKEEPKVDLEAEKLINQKKALVKIDALCSELLFEVNKTILTNDKLTNLDKIATLINENNLTVTVKGYASKDGNPVRNKTLSIMRANYIKGELVKRGVKSNTIQHEGAKDSEELFDNGNESLKAKNRTVRIKTIH